MRAIGGENAAKHHRVDLAVAGQRLRSGVVPQGDGIAYPRLADRFDGGGDVADLTGAQLVAWLQLAGAHNAHFHHIKFRAGRHHTDGVARFQPSFFHADVDDNALVAVVVAVKNQRLQRCVVVPLGRRHMMHNGFQHLIDVDALFR